MSASQILRKRHTLVKDVWFWEVIRDVTPEDVDIKIDTRKSYGSAEMFRSLYTSLKPVILAELEELLVYIYGKNNNSSRVVNRCGDQTEVIRVKGVHRDNKELRAAREDEARARLEARAAAGGDQAVIDRCVKEYNELFRRCVGDANVQCTRATRQTLATSWTDLDEAAGVAGELKELSVAQARVEELKRAIRDRRAAALLVELEKDGWTVSDGKSSRALPEPVVAEIRQLLSKEGRAFRDNTVTIRTEA